MFKSVIPTDIILREKEFKFCSNHCTRGINIRSHSFDRIQPWGISIEIRDNSEASHSLLIKYYILLKNPRTRGHTKVGHNPSQNHHSGKPEIHSVGGWRERKSIRNITKDGILLLWQHSRLKPYAPCPGDQSNFGNVPLLLGSNNQWYIFKSSNNMHASGLFWPIIGLWTSDNEDLFLSSWTWSDLWKCLQFKVMYV